MKRYMLLFTLIFVAAIGTQPGDIRIDAQYTETVTYSDSGITGNALIHEWTTQSGSGGTTLIARTLSNGPMGSYIYALTAGDSLGNKATHDVAINLNGPFGMKLTSPSPHGMGSSPQIQVQLETSSNSQCEWSFHTEGDQPNLQPMVADPTGLKHVIGNFYADYRFEDGETVPILFECQDASAGFVRKVIPIGWGSTEEQSVAATLGPRPVADPNDQAYIHVTSADITQCDLTSVALQTPRNTMMGLRHRFENLPLGAQGTTYTLVCTNAHGTVLPQQELSVLQNFATQKVAVEQSFPTAPVDTNNVVFGVTTNRQADCQQGLGNPAALGPLANGRLHQREISLIDGTSTGQVTCTAPNGDVGQVQGTVVVDTTGPTVRFVETPTICGDKIVLKLAGSDDHELTHAIIKANGYSIMREWGSGAAQMQYIQGGFQAQAGDAITVLGIDSAGNIGAVHTINAIASPDPVAVCGVQGLTQYISLIAPSNGGTNLDVFDVEVASEFDSTCVWDAGGASQSFITSDGFRHTITDFPTASGMARESQVTLTVTCTDAAGQDTTTSFPLGWYQDTPSISLSASPQTVTDVTNTFSTVTVTSDQDVQCRYDAGAYTTTYATSHQFQINMPFGTPTRTVIVDCTNRANLTASDSIVIDSNYPSALTIRLDSPTVTNNPQPTVTITTSLLAACDLTAGGQTQSFQTTDSVTHDRQLSLGDGVFAVTVDCTEVLRPTASSSLSFDLTIDSTPPTITLTNKATTCGPSSYVVTGNVTDNVAVDTIDISFAGDTYTTSSLPFTINNLALTAGQIYTLTVGATDTAGNAAPQKSTAQVQAQTPDVGACDAEPPVVTFQTNVLNTGTEAWITCIDNDACKDVYEIGTGPVDGTCTYLTRSFAAQHKEVLTADAKVCWKVEDLSGNLVTGEQVVTVTTFPNHCTNGVQDNDETGLDCGGSCAPCQAGGCFIDADCGANEICHQGSCYTIGATCTLDSDCSAGESCINGECREPGVQEPPVCELDSDCIPGDVCESGVCYTQDGGICFDDTDCSAGESCVQGTCGRPNYPGIGGCSADSDCVDGVCSDGYCWVLAETSCSIDADCGVDALCIGNVCNYLVPPDGSACLIDADCASGICDIDGICAQNSCANGVQDGAESDVDCGGACGPCAVGANCEIRSDCESSKCNYGVCEAPTCEDGIRNGAETDIDCGGTCGACGEGSGCETDIDCQSGVCSYGICTAEALQQNNPGSFDPGNQDFIPQQARLNPWGILLVVLGILLALGGGGYIYWEKSHLPPPKKAPTGSYKPLGGIRSDPLAPTTPATPAKPQTPDFATSKLRKEARKKKRSERTGTRKKLVSEFESKKKPQKTRLVPKKTPAKPPARPTPAPAPKEAPKKSTGPKLAPKPKPPTKLPPTKEAPKKTPTAIPKPPAEPAPKQPSKKPPVSP